MRPTLPPGFVVGTLPEITGSNFVDGDIELYRLALAPGSYNHILLAKKSIQHEIERWLSIQPRECIARSELLNEAGVPAQFVVFALDMVGRCVADDDYHEKTGGELIVLMSGMAKLANESATAQSRFPKFQKSTTWISRDGSVATLCPLNEYPQTEQLRVRETARMFFLIASGLSSIEEGRRVSLKSWAKHASEDLSRIVDRCIHLLPDSAIQTFEELQSELVDGGRGNTHRSQTRDVSVKSQGGLSRVAGMQTLKALLMREVVEPVRNPEHYQRYGLSIPNGILLFGPPGCGKTYIARQLAEELGHHFIEIIPSEVGSPYIHQTSGKIREVFEEAAASAPAVIFIDEFEALVPSRAELGGHQQYKAEEVNEFLAHLNECAKKNVLVIAATNEPNKIDSAVRRTGRLDKLIYVGPPDEMARIEMLSHHLKNRPMDPALVLKDVAARTSGYSASDIRFLVDEASREALQSKSDISMQCFERAMTRVPASVPLSVEMAFQAMEQRGAS